MVGLHRPALVRGPGAQPIARDHSFLIAGLTILRAVKLAFHISFASFFPRAQDSTRAARPAPQCATLSPARAGVFSATMLDVITPLYLTDQWPLGAGKPVGVHAQGVPGVHLA